MSLLRPLIYSSLWSKLDYSRFRSLRKPAQKYSKFYFSRMSTNAASSGHSISPDEMLTSWELPQGFDTGIQVYNTAAQKKVPFILQNKNIVSWYMCGPTVYDEAHIGHACCYLKFDIIRRILEQFFNINVIMVLGITDIDDKIIHRSKELKVTLSDVAQFYENDFLQDIGTLGILPPTVITRVSDHIPHIIAFCENIIAKDLAYVTKTGTVYFNLKKFGRSGKLGKFCVEVEEENDFHKLIDPEKQDPKDFALWKGVKPGEPWWKSPWGRGRPGWHIECSAMASTIFGKSIDIHSGGIDLIFPHHTNEETQSQAYHGTSQWANYWLHTGHLTLKDDVKMSKSLKNTVSIKDFLKKHSANDLRIFCLKNHYRSGGVYSEETLDNAKGISAKIKNFFHDAQAFIEGKSLSTAINEVSIIKRLEETKVTVGEALSNDFDTQRALDDLLDLIDLVNNELKSTNQSKSNLLHNDGTLAIAACTSYLRKILQLFGVEFIDRKGLLMSSEKSSATLAQVVNSVVSFRSKVRLYALTTGPNSKPQYMLNQPNKDIEEKSSPEELPIPPDKPPESKGEMNWTAQQKLSKEQMKLKRKAREPLMDACDEIRNDLYLAGIDLKDRGRGSTWEVVNDKSLEAKRSGLSSHDAFDPQYEPRSV